MKRKPTQHTVVPEEILEEARRSVLIERVRRPQRCTVCSAECAPNSNEGLCWVCRRLKISAWRDIDQQINAQE